MAIEIERKFLVKNNQYKTESYKSYHIIQGYLVNNEGLIVRIRIRDNEGFITIKGASNESGLSRYEWEKELPIDEAKQLIFLCGNRVIDKTRFLVKADSLTFEVDEFHGENEGLVVAEIELPSEDAIFEKKTWIAEEVTGNKKYYNSSLILNPYKKWND